MILIGSRALAIRLGSLFTRTPKDWDYICTHQEFAQWDDHENQLEGDISQEKGKFIIKTGSSIFEFELVSPCESSQLFYYLVKECKETLHTDIGKIPNLDLLFTIKSSHKYKKNSPHFWKNAQDYHLMKSLGAKVRPEYEDFLRMREKETYNYKHPNLNQSKANFFSDDVKYTYDHDDIHKAVATFERPAYTYYLKDGHPVLCDRNKFEALDHKVKIAGVVEEAAVLAIERSLVPRPNGMTPKQAWMFALSKVCTSITSGWFREFAYENLPEVLQNYNSHFWDDFNKALKSGKVRPFSKEY